MILSSSVMVCKSGSVLGWYTLLNLVLRRVKAEKKHMAVIRLTMKVVTKAEVEEDVSADPVAEPAEVRLEVFMPKISNPRSNFSCSSRDCSIVCCILVRLIDCEIESLQIYKYTSIQTCNGTTTQVYISIFIYIQLYKTMRKMR